MAFLFPFFKNNPGQKRRKETLEQAEERQEKIRRAGAKPKPKPKSGTDPRKVLEQYRSRLEALPSHKNKHGRHLGHERETSRDQRREDFFSSLSALNPLDRIADAVDKRLTGEEERLRLRQTRELSKIKVIAFVGPSGTGKSTRALRVASERKITCFIDDGLLIEGGRIVAGSSAKKADTKIESVRQAIFLDDTRAANMRRSLLERKPERLMILGTSDNMISKICHNLWLQEPYEIIRIEDVSSAEERRLAKTTRMTQGSHTIPVPSMEIKHEFSGYFQDPLKLFRRKRERDKQAPPLQESERTVVRPTFSSLGSYLITDEALAALIKLLLSDVEGLAKVLRVRIQKEVYGAVLSLELALYYGYNARQVMLDVQQILLEQVEYYTSINILSVNVSCRKVVDPGLRTHA